LDPSPKPKQLQNQSLREVFLTTPHVAQNAGLKWCCERQSRAARPVSSSMAARTSLIAGEFCQSASRRLCTIPLACSQGCCQCKKTLTGSAVARLNAQQGCQCVQGSLLLLIFDRLGADAQEPIRPGFGYFTTGSRIIPDETDCIATQEGFNKSTRVLNYAATTAYTEKINQNTSYLNGFILLKRSTSTHVMDWLLHQPSDCRC
jgi:hypothetical protein